MSNMLNIKTVCCVDDGLFTCSTSMSELVALMQQILTYQISFIWACMKRTFRISIQNGIKLYYLQVKHPQKISSEGLYKMKIRESVQLRTLLAMSTKKLIDRDRALPSYQRLKTMVRRHIDQMTRRRNFEVQNEKGWDCKFFVLSCCKDADTD